MVTNELIRLAADSCDVGVLAELAAHGDYEVRKVVAGNLCTPVGVLLMFCNDRHISVRDAVVKNPNLPVSAMVGLADDWVNNRFEEFKRLLGARVRRLEEPVVCGPCEAPAAVLVFVVFWHVDGPKGELRIVEAVSAEAAVRQVVGLSAELIRLDGGRFRHYTDYYSVFGPFIRV